MIDDSNTCLRSLPVQLAGEMFSSRTNHVSAYNEHQPTKIEADFSKNEKMDTAEERNNINDTGGILAEHEIDVTTNYEEQNATDPRDGEVQPDQVRVSAMSACEVQLIEVASPMDATACSLATTVVVTSMPRYNTMSHKRNHKAHRDATAWIRAQADARSLIVQTDADVFQGTRRRCLNINYSCMFSAVIYRRLSSVFGDTHARYLRIRLPAAVRLPHMQSTVYVSHVVYVYGRHLLRYKVRMRAHSRGQYVVRRVSQ
jgi:hypothetical protein